MRCLREMLPARGAVQQAVQQHQRRAAPGPALHANTLPVSQHNSHRRRGARHPCRALKGGGSRQPCSPSPLNERVGLGEDRAADQGGERSRSLHTPARRRRSPPERPSLQRSAGEVRDRDILHEVSIGPRPGVAVLPSPRCWRAAPAPAAGTRGSSSCRRGCRAASAHCVAASCATQAPSRWSLSRPCMATVRGPCASACSAPVGREPPRAAGPVRRPPAGSPPLRRVAQPVRRAHVDIEVRSAVVEVLKREVCSKSCRVRRVRVLARLVRARIGERDRFDPSMS